MALSHEYRPIFSWFTRSTRDHFHVRRSNNRGNSLLLEELNQWQLELAEEADMENKRSLMWQGGPDGRSSGGVRGNTIPRLASEKAPEKVHLPGAAQATDRTIAQELRLGQFE